MRAHLETPAAPNLRTPAWPDAPAEPRLRAGTVQVWRAWLDDAAGEVRETLSTSEWLRAGRFHFAQDRERFIAARGLLRSILGRYLRLDPARLNFQNGPHGKPALEGVCTPLRFNLSHSDNLFLLAVTPAREVGIDVEQMRADVPFESLAEHYFEPEDAWDIRLLRAPEKASRFYDIWTSTEARLKAGGRGFSEGAKVREPERWALRRLAPAEGYAAALAVEGGEFHMECWSWPT